MTKQEFRSINIPFREKFAKCFINRNLWLSCYFIRSYSYFTRSARLLTSLLTVSVSLAMNTLYLQNIQQTKPIKFGPIQFSPQDGLKILYIMGSFVWLLIDIVYIVYTLCHKEYDIDDDFNPNQTLLLQVVIMAAVVFLSKFFQVLYMRVIPSETATYTGFRLSLQKAIRVSLYFIQSLIVIASWSTIFLFSMTFRKKLD